MNTVLVIGGTTEAREAARRLEDEGYRVIVSVATSLGELYAGHGEVVSGSKDEAALARHVEDCGARIIVDCTHPFAVNASTTARRAAGRVAIPYLRFTRADSGIDEETHLVDDWEAAVDLLTRMGGRALLTIGVRNLERFTAAGIDFAARVLPLPDSIGECFRIGMRPEDIIAAFPPFDVDFNRACIRKAGARVLVMKDSGSEGGIPEKLAAARAESIPAVVVRRPPDEEGVVDIEELLARVREMTAS